MANAFDVAQYILEITGTLPAVKLQKLVYYCQAWGLVWDGEPLFGDEIEAWANGPVVRSLYARHRGRYQVDTSTFTRWGSSDNLNATQKETINAVLETYGGLAPYQLSELTHRELPWIEARAGLQRWERGYKTIALDKMAEFYETLV